MCFRAGVMKMWSCVESGEVTVSGVFRVVFKRERETKSWNYLKNLVIFFLLSSKAKIKNFVPIKIWNSFVRVNPSRVLLSTTGCYLHTYIVLCSTLFLCELTLVSLPSPHRLRRGRCTHARDMHRWSCPLVCPRAPSRSHPRSCAAFGVWFSGVNTRSNSQALAWDCVGILRKIHLKEIKRKGFLIFLLT